MASQTSIDFSNRDLRRLILPLIVEQLLALTVGLADSLMVARVGEAAVAAVSLVDAVNVLLVSAFSALATGGAVVAGQYLGRREPDKANRAAQQLLVFMAECALVITAALYLLKGFILQTVFGAIEPDVAAYADTYFMIVEASTVFLAVYNAGAALFRVMGNSGISMRVSLVMNVVNVAGNAILIFGLRLGVAGVAIPTLLSKAVAAALMVALLSNQKLTLHLSRPFSLRQDKFIIRSILRLGVPNGIEGSMFQLGKLLLLSVVTPFGTASVTANSIANTMSSFQILAPQSIGLGMVTVVSRCVGAGAFDRARSYTRKLLKWGYATLAATVALICLALPLVLWLYGLSDEATGYARVLILSHGFVGLALWVPSFQLPQCLRAAGDTRYTMLVSSGSMWLFRVILGIFLARGLNWGVIGIWAAMYVDWVFRSLLFILRYRGRRWELKALKE